MGIFGFGGGSIEQGAAKGRSEDAVYRGEVSPLAGQDPSQPVEFFLTPEESEAAQRGVLAAKTAAGRVESEPIEVSRERIFGEQAQPVRAEPMGTQQSVGFVAEAERFANASNPANPGNQGNGEEHISFDFTPESDQEKTEDETAMPSVLGGF